MPFGTVRQAIDDIRAGKLVIVADDESRENEGDFVCAAEAVTPELINFMTKHGRGLICLTLTEERIRRLQLPMMVAENRSSMGTAFTVSIEARRGITTGVSAADRLATVCAAIAPDAVAADLVSPGHVFPLRAHPGGVLARRGHTEGALELCALAGLAPAAVLCELMNPDGTMARGREVADFGARHGLPLLAIDDLVAWRRGGVAA